VKKGGSGSEINNFGSVSGFLRQIISDPGGSGSGTLLQIQLIPVVFVQEGDGEVAGA